MENQSAQLAGLTAGQRERPSTLQQDQNGLTGTLLIREALLNGRGECIGGGLCIPECGGDGACGRDADRLKSVDQMSCRRCFWGLIESY